MKLELQREGKGKMTEEEKNKFPDMDYFYYKWDEKTYLCIGKVPCCLKEESGTHLALIESLYLRLDGNYDEEFSSKVFWCRKAYEASGIKVIDRESNYIIDEDGEVDPVFLPSF